jgi:hypothetical protein
LAHPTVVAPVGTGDTRVVARVETSPPAAFKSRIIGDITIYAAYGVRSSDD